MHAIFMRVAELRKATIRYVTSVCPSVWNNWDLTGVILMEMDKWIFSRKSVEKIKLSLKSDKNNGDFT